MYNWANTTAITTIAGLSLGNSLYFGWTAEYAKYRETYDGFLASGVQNWPNIVDRVVAKIKARIK